MMEWAKDIAKEHMPQEFAELVGVEYQTLTEYGALMLELGIELGARYRLAHFEAKGDGFKVWFTPYCEFCPHKARVR